MFLKGPAKNDCRKGDDIASLQHLAIDFFKPTLEQTQKNKKKKRLDVIS